MIIKATSHDPYQNLSAEEYLLDNVSEATLYLWQNQNTIVIGKHQNPWKECNAAFLESDGGHLARRLSGGGTVFHDLGNLNFTFVMPIQLYDLDRTTNVILRAAQSLNIPAQRTGRNDITAEGRKFSGNAFCVRKNGAYHHGTLLFDVDMSAMSRYLMVDESKMKSKGIKSVHSRVVNLKEYRFDLTIGDLEDAMCAAFLDEFGGSSKIHTTDELPNYEIAQLYKKYSSWEWKYGESPDFDVNLTTRFEWGGMSISLCTKDGKIKSAKVDTDAMDTRIGDFLPDALCGIPYESIADAVLSLNADANQLSDIAKWLKSKI